MTTEKVEMSVAIVNSNNNGLQLSFVFDSVQYCLLIKITHRDARRQNNISLLEETLDCAKGLRQRSNLLVC